MVGYNSVVYSAPEGDRLLQEIVTRIRRIGRPTQIILFGSRARGKARPSSDYDVLVIQHSEQPRYQRSAPFYAALADLPAEVEVLVYTPAEVEEWSGVSQAFVTTAVREGRLLYEDQG